MCTVYLKLPSMEKYHNKEENNESSELINFSIRDYVADIRKKDPKKCWPFGSLGVPDNDEVFSSYPFSKSTCLHSSNSPGDVNSSDNTPEHSQAPNPSKVDIFNGREDLPKAATDDSKRKGIYDGSSGSTSREVKNGKRQHENNVFEGTETGQNVAADNEEPESNQSRRKPQKFRLLADIYRDPASEHRPRCDITHPAENVNGRFVAETEDDQSNDNVTLGEFVRKQKGVEIANLILKKKRSIRVEMPRVDQDKKSKHGFTRQNDSKVVSGVHLTKRLRIDDIDSIMAKCNKDYRQKFNTTEATETAIEASEMEAVMLLARHFKEEDPPANERIRELENTTKDPVVYADTLKKFIKEKLQKVYCAAQTDDSPKGTTATGFAAHKEILKNCETLICSVNRNPADLSIPSAENKFMR